MFYNTTVSDGIRPKVNISIFFKQRKKTRRRNKYVNRAQLLQFQLFGKGKIIGGKYIYFLGLLWWLNGKESTCQCRRQGFHPWVRKIPWRRKWQPTIVFLPGKPHEQRSLAGYSSGGGHKRVGHNLSTKQQRHMLVFFLLFKN